MLPAICRHSKMGGGRCGSPAMRGQDYCYFHAGAHRAIPSVNLWSDRRMKDPRLSPKRWARTWGTGTGTGTGTGEAAAIQLGFTRLIWGLERRLLNVRQAKLMLRALHKAAAGYRERTATGDSAVASNELRFAIDSSLVNGMAGD